jgi:hypothetical protein
MTGKITDAAFALWQEMQSAEFYVLMAYKHGDAKNLRIARERLADAALDALKAEEAAEKAARTLEGIV